jgi:hypothetical protein
MAIDPERYYRRRAAAAVLREAGIPVSESTLATRASRGGDAPRFRRFGRVPLYQGAELLAWIEARMSAPVRTTSELEVERQRDHHSAARYQNTSLVRTTAPGQVEKEIAEKRFGPRTKTPRSDVGGGQSPDADAT